MTGRPACVSRRGVVRAVLTGAFATGLGGLAREPAIAQENVQENAKEKMSKRAAEYQDTPKGMLMCATCTLFVRPNSCKVVEGEVKPEGWCKAFDLAD